MTTKEEKQLENELKKGNSFMHIVTTTQREEYYEEVVRFNIKKIEERIEAGEGTEGRFSTQAQNYEHALGQMDKINTHTLRWLKHAEEAFNSKLMVCVKKLQKFGLLKRDVMLEVGHVNEIHNRGLDFLIEGYTWNKDCSKNYVGKVHARLIWVEGYEVVSHWRFICTLKK